MGAVRVYEMAQVIAGGGDGLGGEQGVETVEVELESRCRG